MLTQPFLPQASRQFDQEGRKKFFTLDMNNILLEWVGQLLNHRQADLSSLSSFLFSLFHSFFSRFPSRPLLLSLEVFYFLSFSHSVLIKCFSFPFFSRFLNFLSSLLAFCSNTLYPFTSITLISHLFLSCLSVSTILNSLSTSTTITVLFFFFSSSQYRAAGPGATSWGAIRHLLAHGGIRAVQQRSPPQTAEEAQSQHPGEWGFTVDEVIKPLQV